MTTKRKSFAVLPKRGVRVTDEMIRLLADADEDNFYQSYFLRMALANIAFDIEKTRLAKGWKRRDSEDRMINLLYSELAEANEAIREGNPRSKKIPKFSAVEEEFADLMIRLVNACDVRGFRLAEAVIAKMAYNKTRPVRHGGKKF